MSTAAHPIATPFSFAAFTRKQPVQPRRPAEPRQSSPEQARALQAISHAIEHLVDSRLFDTWETPSDAEAVHILMACSRSVFDDCKVIKPWPQRVSRVILSRLQLEPQSR